ncbi:MAG TPA: EF-Tu/IF-2/RF-3 family GTPase [Nitrospirota bacterium]|nr:EF-Tu/IF-2/RF-3 family GTPase [Nitrospirota bacterium]
MAVKGKAKSKSKKRTSPKTPRRPVGKRKSLKKPRKKSVVKKSAKKKALKKKTLKKKALKKKTAKKAVAKKVASKKATAKESLLIEPGPPTLAVPPVEEPAPHEEAIGVVTHYYSHLGVAIVQINKGTLETGDTVRIKGHTTDFTQEVDSMEYEHQHLDRATPGQSVGIKIRDHARVHDILYRTK